MAKSMVDAATRPKKIKPESGLERRNSTGGAALMFSEPIPIPNYLRASIGSCHDLCKYGSRRDSSEQRRNTNNMGSPEPKSKTRSNRGNSSATGSSMEQRRNKNNMGSPEPKSNRGNSSAESGIAEQRRNRNNMGSAEPKSKTNKSACSARNNEGKRVSSSLPRTTSSESPSRIPTSKTRRSKSVPRKSGPEKLLESSDQCCKKSDESTVEEIKIINVVETNEDVDDENEKMDSARSDHCGSRELGLKREDEDIISWKDIRLRRVVSEGDSDNMKKECMRIGVMGKNKVRALVHSFETLITTPHSQASKPSSTSP